MTFLWNASTLVLLWKVTSNVYGFSWAPKYNEKHWISTLSKNPWIPKSWRHPVRIITNYIPGATMLWWSKRRGGREKRRKVALERSRFCKGHKHWSPCMRRQYLRSGALLNTRPLYNAEDQNPAFIARSLLFSSSSSGSLKFLFSAMAR